MRKNIKTLLIACGVLASVLVSSCYEDKGNYNYRDITQLTIEHNSSDNLSLYVGDTLRVHPIITYSREDHNMHLSYSWKLRGEEIGTDSTLEYVVSQKNPTGDDYSELVFTITDDDTGIQYRYDYQVYIVTEMESTGFLLLTKKEGKERLYKLINNGYTDDGYSVVNDFRIIDSIYMKQNPGMQIPTGTFKLRENYALIDRPQRQEVLLAPNDIQFVDGKTFKLDNTYKDFTSMFYQGLPVGMRVKDALFMRYYDLISDEDGHLYSRIRSTDKFFNPSGDLFLNEPVKLEGEDEPLKDIEFIPFRWGNVEHSVLWDKYKNRLLMVWDMKYDDVFEGGYTYIVGKMEPITSALNIDAKWPSAEESGCPYPKIEELLAHYKMIHVSSYIDYVGGRLRGFFLLVKDQQGNLYQYTIEMTRNWSLPKYTFEKDDNGNVKITWRKLIAGDAAIMEDSDTKFYTLPSPQTVTGNAAYLTLVAHGADLYVYNRAVSEPKLVKVHTFDSDIVLLEANTYGNKFGAVALKNGSFHTFTIASLLNGIYTPLYDSPQGVDLGTPIDMFYQDWVGNWDINWQ